MNFDEQNLAPDDPLAIAKRLEECVRNGQTGIEQSGDWDETPNDFQQARLALDLIFRAALNDKALPNKTNIVDGHGRHPGPDQTESDTDRWGVAPADTQPNAKPGPWSSLADGEQTPERGLLPEKIGRFQVVRELGRGGFGVVLLGRDPELARMVALKIPRLEMLIDEDARSRFNREACLVSMLSHPAIVPVYEYSSGPGVPFIAFAWCRGKSLADWLSQTGNRVAPRLAARIVSQLAGAIQYAHQRDVIHRDLKPGNILLDWATDHRQDQHFDDNEFELIDALRITDFGLAKSLLPESYRLTRVGAMVGTPSYMAPEQFSGRGDATVSSDIYALGAILYELLTGDPPLRRETDLATMRAIETKEPIPPRKTRPDVSKDLEAVVLKCLEKSPQNRYRSAFELQNDLENVIAGRPVLARRPSLAERIVRWCRRKPALATAVSLVIAGFLFASWQWWRAEWNGSEARRFLEHSVLQRSRAERNLDRAETAIEQMLNEVATVLQHIPQLESVRTRLLEQALDLQQQLAAEEADDPEIRFRAARSRRRMAEIWRAMGLFDEALAAAENADHDLAWVAGGDGGPNQLDQWKEQARLAKVRATIHQRRHELELALVAHNQSSELWSRIVALDPDQCVLVELVSTRHLAGVVQESLHRPKQAEVIWNAALALLDSIPNDNHDHALAIERGQLLNSLGVLHANQKRVSESEACYIQAIEVLQPIAAAMPDRIELGYKVAVTAFNLGNAHHRRVENQMAEHFYQIAYDLVRPLIDSFPDQVDYRQMVVRIAIGLGSSLNRNGEPEDAARILDHALSIEERLPEDVRRLPNQIRERSMLLNNLGSVYKVGLGDHNRASSVFQECRELLRGQVNLDPFDAFSRRSLSMAEGNLAACAVELGNTDEAEVLFRSALGNAITALDLNRGDTSSWSNFTWQFDKLGRLLLREGRIDDVLELTDDILAPVEGDPRRIAAVARLLAGFVSESARPTVQAGDGSLESGEATVELSSEQHQRLYDVAVQRLIEAVEQGQITLQDNSLPAELRFFLDDPRLKRLIKQ